MYGMDLWMMVSKQSRTTGRWAGQGYGNSRVVGMAGMVCLVCVEGLWALQGGGHGRDGMFGMCGRAMGIAGRWAWQGWYVWYVWKGYGHCRAVGMAGMVCLVCVENAQRAPQPPTPHTEVLCVKGQLLRQPRTSFTRQPNSCHTMLANGAPKPFCEHLYRQKDLHGFYPPTCLEDVSSGQEQRHVHIGTLCGGRRGKSYQIIEERGGGVTRGRGVLGPSHTHTHTVANDYMEVWGWD